MIDNKVNLCLFNPLIFSAVRINSYEQLWKGFGGNLYSAEVS